MIEHLKEFPPNGVAFACKRQVTRHDYEKILEPVVEVTLEQSKKLQLYYQIDPDFCGIEPGAVSEDFKEGIKHLHRWERIAVVTNVDWIRYAIRAFGFLMPGTTKIFPLEEAPKAREWIGSMGRGMSELRGIR
jgi:hypothetical protein